MSNPVFIHEGCHVAAMRLVGVGISKVVVTRDATGNIICAATSPDSIGELLIISEEELRGARNRIKYALAPFVAANLFSEQREEYRLMLEAGGFHDDLDQIRQLMDALGIPESERLAYQSQLTTECEELIRCSGEAFHRAVRTAHDDLLARDGITSEEASEFVHGVDEALRTL